ncbi:DUF2059 domain-containing protein [Pararhizobium mangrovi]|uniref:DUF2059 domain-containing protein n=1 Tax=Pararhizobium mangrovi TaxID=2590452 RepID=A0A506UEK9_9HYPH|nr:DUF2059 domain-containing protein [Pararhizobium mangrovi]TPW31189.1 DUF2059 domain-containing protein [Pararhizobium mangrovi]
MTPFFRRGGLVTASFAVAMLALSSAAPAQDAPSKEQLDAARNAIDALNATDRFDAILPNAAAQIKHSFIQAEPNYENQITKTVDDQALKLAPRRADLENEIAKIYAKDFTADQLKAIAKFYNSDAGKALLDKGDDVAQETLKAANIWASGVSRDLATASRKTLESQIGKTVKAQPSETSKTDQ